MKIRRWVSRRGPDFIRRRAGALLTRYGITATKAERRIQASVAVLAEYGCSPTFPTPGRVVEKHTDFIRSIQRAGAEIAVHSYDHVDLKGYPPVEASHQLTKAARTFDRFSIENHGFRCPYLSWTPELLAVLPPGLFGYSSNEAIEWDLPSLNGRGHNRILDTINHFYEPRPATEVVSVPHMRNGLVEIPVSVPDDLQLHDGLQLQDAGIAQAWADVLDQTYTRGEIFNLIFHPELGDRCLASFRALLDRATSLRPRVWMAKLCEVSDWWREKACFHCEITRTADGWRIEFFCTDRATILARDLKTPAHLEPWSGPYYRLQMPVLEIPGESLPLLGLADDAPEGIVTFLREQGYILSQGELSSLCAIYLDSAALSRAKTEVEIVNLIEDCRGPLVRYWRWPDGARSALSITGDLDALTLFDYISRLSAH